MRTTLTTYRQTLLPFVLITLAGTILPPANVQAQTRTVVFAVSGSGAEGSMDPVVVVEGKQLRAPYDEEKEEAQQKFGEQQKQNANEKSKTIRPQR